jgi:anti-anti-sigma regulatory factor
MTLRIEKHSDATGTTLRLMGRIRSEHLQELKEQLSAAGTDVVLDLDEVTLVDLDTVHFLGACEATGTQLLHCSKFIREWMLQEAQHVSGKAEA